MNVFFSNCREAIDSANGDVGFGCFYSEKKDENRDIHLHECCEVLFCLSGGKNFFIDERIYDVEPGDVFVINPLEAHKITSGEGEIFKRYVLQVHPSFLYDNSTAESNLAYCFDLRSKNVSNRLPLTGEEREKLAHVFGKLNACVGFGDDILKRDAVHEILVNVNRYFMEKNKGYTYHSSFKNHTLAAVLKYINTHYSEPISIDTVAENCFISVSTLGDLFKRYMGTTAAKYIKSKRMTEAKRLLQNGESVASAAEKCGYTDYTSFIRAFKRITGVPPGHFRKM